MESVKNRHGQPPHLMSICPMNILPYASFQRKENGHPALLKILCKTTALVGILSKQGSKGNKRAKKEERRPVDIVPAERERAADYSELLPATHKN